ncbi:MAG: hypothetical protein ACR2RF_24965 [Geminicoccaceae bacterium]
MTSLTQKERDELRRLCEAGDEHPDVAAGLMAHGSKMALEHRRYVHLEAWMALPKLLDALDEAERKLAEADKIEYRAGLDFSGHTQS